MRACCVCVVCVCVCVCVCSLTQLCGIMTVLLPYSIRLGFQKNAFNKCCYSHMGSLPSRTHFMGTWEQIRKSILNDSICLPLQVHTLCIVFEFSHILCNVSLYGVQQMVSNNGCGVRCMCQRHCISHCLFGCLRPAVNIHNHTAQVEISDKSLHPAHLLPLKRQKEIHIHLALTNIVINDKYHFILN